MTELLKVMGSLLLGVFRSTLQKPPPTFPRKKRSRNTYPPAPIPFGLRFALKNVNVPHTWGLAPRSWAECSSVALEKALRQNSRDTGTCLHVTVPATVKARGWGCATGAKSTCYRGSRSLPTVGTSLQGPLLTT